MVLRSVVPVTQDSRCPHSGIAENLWLDVAESMVLLDLHSCFYSGMASLYSHPNVDCQKGTDAVNREFNRLLQTIPYMNKDYEDSGMTTERTEAVKKYKELMARIEGK